MEKLATDGLATDTSGNTKQRCLKKRRDWQFTLNEVDKYVELRKYIMGLKSLNYMISCEEKAPTTGHKHIHIYCQFEKPFKPSIKKMQGAHIEACRGTPQQNIAYIKKDGNIIDEWGDVKKWGGKSIKDVKEMSKEERDELPIQYFNIVKKINDEEANDININDIFKDVKVYYIYGDSGVGKTKKAIEMCKENGYESINMVKFDGTFWNGIGNSKACIYDDFRDSHMKPSEFINFIDYNKHQLNIKGSYKLNNYEFIIITSVQSPDDLYKNVQEKDQEPKKQWLRRMKIIYLDNSFFD